MKKVMRRNILLTVLAFLLCLSVGLSAGFATVFAETTPKTLAEVTLTMEDGALVRASEPTGIRFRSFMSEADYEGLMANVGEGKAYKSVNFGMLIAPEDYLTTGRELTEANVFGENAIYSYGDTAEEGKTRIINVWDSEMYDYTDGKFFAGIITNVAGTNYNRVFAGQAYVKATAQDGTASYLFAAATDNHRSVIGVAQAAIASGDTSEAVQSFVKNADLVGLVKSVENCYQTTANVVDYKEGVISATATAAGMYVKLDKDVIVKNGAGCDYMRLYLKSTSVAWCKILPVPASGEKQWSWFDHTLDSNGIKISDGVYEQYVDIPLNDRTVHDFTTYDIELWSGADKDHNITITKVEYISLPTLEETALKAESWYTEADASFTENADGTFTAGGWQFGLTAAYMQSAIEAGYTHLKLDYTLVNRSGDQSDAAICVEISGGSYVKVYTGTSGSLRFDLANATDGSSYRKIYMQGRQASSHGAAIDVALTVTSARLYKSEETATWTKSNTSIYCAEEDGFIVLDTIYCGNDAKVLSSEAFCAKYFNNKKGNEAGQGTMVVSGRYLVAGSNTRGMVWGDKGEPVHIVSDTASTEFATGFLYAGANRYAEGDKFYMGLDHDGVYQFRADYVSNRHSNSGACTFTYVDENTFTASMIDGQKLAYVNTQEMIAAGYTKVVITADEYTSGQLWVGNDSWSGDTAYMHGLGSGKSIELDLSKFTTDNPWLVIYSSGATTATVQVRFF